MSDFNYIEYLKNNPLLKTKTNKLITESQETSENKILKLKSKIREEILSILNEEDIEEETNLDLTNEAKGDEEETPEEEIPGDEVDMEIDTEMPADSGTGLSVEEKTIQDSLKTAYDNASAIGDQKLANQIGNSITFFTRTHVVER
jgi:hypothetical protein